MKNLPQLRWYWVTKGLGFIIVFYELLLNIGDPNRGTLIIIGAGMMGLDLAGKGAKGDS